GVAGSEPDLVPVLHVPGRVPAEGLVRCNVCTLEFCSACKASWHPDQDCQENVPITAFLPGES
ncbi:hypothetical protein M9458_034935, partial [Cirrhinus mrigala]